MLHTSDSSPVRDVQKTEREQRRKTELQKNLLRGALEEYSRKIGVSFSNGLKLLLGDEGNREDLATALELPGEDDLRLELGKEEGDPHYCVQEPTTIWPSETPGSRVRVEDSDFILTPDSGAEEVAADILLSGDQPPLKLDEDDDSDFADCAFDLELDDGLPDSESSTFDAEFDNPWELDELQPSPHEVAALVTQIRAELGRVEQVLTTASQNIDELTMDVISRAVSLISGYTSHLLKIEAFREKA